MSREYLRDLTQNVFLWMHDFTDSFFCMLEFSVESCQSNCSLLVSRGRLPPTYTVHFLENIKEETDDRLRIPTEQTVPSQLRPFPSRLVSNERVTDASHFQDVRLFEFDITGSNIE